MQAEITKHRVHALFPVRYSVDSRTFGRPAELTKLKEHLLNLRCDDSLAQLLTKPKFDLTKNERVWKEVSGDGFSFRDLYPQVRQVLGSVAEPALCIALGLDKGELLAQVNGGKPRLWSLPLSNDAKKRSGLPAISMQLENARFFLFRTGIAILDMAWNYRLPADNSLDGLMEGNHELSHGNYKPRKSPSEGVTLPNMNAAVMGQLVEALLPKVDGRRPDIRPERRILYTIAKVKSHLIDQPEAVSNELLEIALALSHRHTKSYESDVATFAKNSFQPFKHVLHFAAVEGGATLVSDIPEPPEVIDKFVDDSAEAKYLPIFVTELHSHYWLLNQTEWLPESKAASVKNSKGLPALRRWCFSVWNMTLGRGLSLDSQKEKEHLYSLYESSVDFRRYFNSPLISQISLHNSFHNLWQRVLEIQPRLQALEGTAQDAARLVQARRSRRVGLLSGAIGGFLVSHELADIASKSGYDWGAPNLYTWLSSTPVLQHSLLGKIHAWELTVFLVSFIGALVGYLAVLIFDTHSEDR